LREIGLEPCPFLMPRRTGEGFSLIFPENFLSGADTRFEAKVVNPNIFDVLIERISYKFYLRNSLISEEAVSGGKTIVSHGEQTFSFPMLINFFEVGQEVYTILQSSSSLCRFTGEIEVKTEWGRVKIPFDQTGRVTIARIS